MMILFFFSSRRRHTRSKRDWSSDVCSSDLERGGGDLCRGCVHATGPVDGAANVLIVYPHIDDPVTQEGIPTPIDSAGCCRSGAVLVDIGQLHSPQLHRVVELLHQIAERTVATSLDSLLGVM